MSRCLGQTAFQDFNVPGQYNNSFNPFENAGTGTNGGSYSFQEGATVGVGGSGGVSVFQNNDTTATYIKASWDFSTNGAVVTVSLILKANSQVSGNKIQLGLINTNNNGLNANAGVAFESFRLIPQSAGVWSLHEQFRSAGSIIDTPLNTVSFTPGNWYKFVLTLTNTAGPAGNYSAACAIYNYGIDGLTPGQNIVTFSTATNHTGQTDVTVSSLWPALRAFQNAGIDAWDDFLAYVPSSLPVLTLSMTSVTTPAGATVTFHALADGPGTLSPAWYTNGVLDPTAAAWTYTTPPLDPAYSNITFVARNSNGSVSNQVSITVLAPSLATITNLPASAIQGTSATLNGQVLSTGNDVPGVTIFYGPSDGGASSPSWAQGTYVALQSGPFAQTVTGLSPSTKYYFTSQATNKTGVAWATPSASFTTAASNSAPDLVSVLTYHYDNSRTGQNTNETILTPANVTPSSFGLLFSYAVDGQVYAEPLYVPGVSIPGQGTHNLVVVATQHDSVYAFDADSNAGPNGGLLWHASLGTSAVTPNNDFGNRYGAYHDIDPEVGITSTPVIDPMARLIYVDAFTHEGASYFHRIHALSITNGSDTLTPVVITASVPGNGVDSVGGVVTFTAKQQLQRPALTLAGSMLYLASSGYADTDPYHGWVIGFNASTLQQMPGYTFNTTPNATTAAFGANAAEGGIWMSGNGLSVDANTNLYFEVGNGSFNANASGGTEYGDSFVKLSTSGGLSVADYFTPYNQSTLAANDTDLGSGGPLLLPDYLGTATHPHLMVGCGKEGKIYLLDRDNLGHFNSTNDSQIIQEIANAVGGTWSSPAYFNSLVFYQGSGDVMKSFKISNGLLSTTPVSQSSTSFGFPGATPVISANVTNNAIAWVIQSDGYPGGQGILHAYNAYNLTQELYNSSMSGTRDNPGGAIKFTVPTVANGKVFVGAAGALAVFGNGTFLVPPVISPAAGLFTNSVTVTMSDATPGATIYYTLDNSSPSTNSAVYSAPLTLTNTTAVRALAFKPGFVPSQVVVSTFINGASLSLSEGFLKQEFYSGALRTDLENAAFTTPPTFIHYLTSFETPSGQGVNYSERVSGLFVPAQTGNYVFFICSDDDSDLFLSVNSSPSNKHLITSETGWSNSREWTTSSGGSVLASKRSDQFAGTTWPGGHTISLTAGTAYYLEADHHQGGGGDNLAVTFKLSTAADPVNGTAPALTGGLISTYAYNNAFIAISSQPQNSTVSAGSNANFSVTASSGYLGGTSGAQGPPILYQWQSEPAGSGTFGNIANATNSTYTTGTLGAIDNGTMFQVVLTTAGISTTSAMAKLSVVSSGPPQLVIIPNNFAFGQVSLGQTNSLMFQMVNTGGQLLNGTATTTAPFNISAGSPFNLNPGQTGQVSVTFAPTSGAAFSNAVIFLSNGGNSTNTVTGSGLTPAQLAVSPAVLAFGYTAVGNTAQASVLATNLSSAPLTNGVALVNSGPFTILSGTPFNLAGSGTTNIVVQFSPGSLGNFSNYLAITTGNGGTSTNALTGAAAVQPRASFIANPTSGAGPLTVSFTDNSTGTITNRFWDWGDGSSTNATVTNLVHTYQIAGTNTVALTVTGPLGTNLFSRSAYIVVANLGPVTVTISYLNNQVQLQWPAGTLQSAAAVTGAYTDVTNAVSPYTVPRSTSTQFFRVRVQ
jgi:PKD repeat protein